MGLLDLWWLCIPPTLPSRSVLLLQQLLSGLLWPCHLKELLVYTFSKELWIGGIVRPWPTRTAAGTAVAQSSRCNKTCV